MDKEMAGIAAALYAMIELVKFLVKRNEAEKVCLLSSENQKKLDDLHEWHKKTDDEGRLLWYVPKHLHVEQEKIVEMLRGISKNQETTARLLGELIDRIESK
jgi:hypothetical protein